MADGQDQDVQLEPLTPDEVDRFFARLEVTPNIRTLPMIGVLQVGEEVEQVVFDYKHLLKEVGQHRALDVLKLVYEMRRG